MADIQFDEEQHYQQPTQQAEEKPFFVRLVLATGMASDERRAEYVLLGVVVFFVVLAFLLPAVINKQPTPKLPPGATLLRVPGQPTRLLDPVPGR